MAKAKCKNCERVAKMLKRKLLSYGREKGDLEGMKRASDYVTPQIDADIAKLNRRIIFWRGLLEMFEPVPEWDTGVFPGSGRDRINKRGGKKRG